MPSLGISLGVLVVVPTRHERLITIHKWLINLVIGDTESVEHCAWDG